LLAAIDPLATRQLPGNWTPAALNAYEATLSNVQHILDTGDQEAAEVLSNL
jgi:hypothetical protein